VVVDDIKLSQLTGVAQPAWTDRVFSVTANSLIGLDANKRPINITLDPATVEIVDGVLYAFGGGGGGSGTVTSVGLSAPGIFSVTGSPVTTAGTLGFSLTTQSANRIFAGPTNGAAAVPSFRALVTADLPAGVGTVTSVALVMPSIFSVSGSPVTTTGSLTAALANQNANLIFAGPTTGSANTPTFRSLVAADIPDISATYQPLNAKLTAISALANASGWLKNNGSGSFSYSTPTKSDVGLGNVDNTSDVNKPVSTATQTALDLKANLTLLGAVSGIATLGVDQKLTASQLPSIAVTEFLGSVASQAAMLALVGEEGDWCIRTNTGLTYVITGPDPTQLSDWTSLSYPTAPVLSVAGRTGVVVLTSADVGLGNVDNTADSAKSFTTAQITSGTFAAARMPAFTGDATSSAGTVALTVVKINGVTMSGLATGILKNTTGTGAPSIAIAADFPTLNQSTTGSAATLTTARAIYGNNFDGSAALTQIITSVFGGTGNGFTKFSGPASTEKTFTLPNSSETLLYAGGPLGTPSGGTVTNLTGTASININGTVGATTPNTGAFTTLATSGLATINSSAFITGRSVPASGAGVEIFYAGNVGSLVSYDRTNSVYRDMTYDGLSHAFSVSGTGRLSIGSAVTITTQDFRFGPQGGTASYARFYNASSTNECLIRDNGGSGVSSLEVAPAGVLAATFRQGANILAGSLQLTGYGAGALTTDASGNVTATSDERLKDIRGKFKLGVAALRGVSPILHKWKKSSGCETTNIYAGFSAQNVRKHIPEAVGVMPNKEKHLTINDRPILATVVNAINEIDRRLEKLEKLALAL